MDERRLAKLLGGPALATLRKRLRQRFERAPSEAILDSFRLGRLNEVEYDALAQLQGMPPRRANSILVDITGIDAALRNAAISPTLQQALERLDGPIVHIATARLRTAMLWSEAVATCEHGGLSALIATAPGLSLLKRMSKHSPATAAQLLQRAGAVLRRLPIDGAPRALLAAEVLGDPHALDNGSSIANLVLAVWRGASRRNISDLEENWEQKESTRDTWAKAGVLVNELARPALFLNLPTQAGRFAASPAGEPGYLSLRALLRTPPRWRVAGCDVFVCENPNVLAIVADRLGPRSAPLVCTEGMPAAAQHALLSQLAQSGAQLHYHGDFDWPGLRIGNYVLQTYDARPWHFGARDYIAAAQAGAAVRQTLKGSQAEASWDPDLTAAMRMHQALVSEENVIEQLLPDLDLVSSSSIK